jgi:hypothetical protein
VDEEACPDRRPENPDPVANSREPAEFALLRGKNELDRRAEAERKLGFLDAETERLEQQVELIREQAALSTDPAQLSQRIDEITASLGTTSQWIRDQQQVFGAMDDLLSDAPPMTTKTSARELQ